MCCFLRSIPIRASGGTLFRSFSPWIVTYVSCLLSAHQDNTTANEIRKLASKIMLDSPQYRYQYYNSFHNLVRILKLQPTNTNQQLPPSAPPPHSSFLLFILPRVACYTRPYLNGTPRHMKLLQTQRVRIP